MQRYVEPDAITRAAGTALWPLAGAAGWSTVTLGAGGALAGVAAGLLVLGVLLWAGPVLAGALDRATPPRRRGPRHAAAGPRAGGRFSPPGSPAPR